MTFSELLPTVDPVALSLHCVPFGAHNRNSSVSRNITRGVPKASYINFKIKLFIMKIEKKIWPKFFQKVLDGDKTFELRLADFECNSGDTLVLREWNPETKEYTGRILEKQVTYVLKTKDIKFWPMEEVEKHGFQIISFK